MIFLFGPRPIAPLHPNNLVAFGGKGKYRQPEFFWFTPVAPRERANRQLL
jgi:hypothetical protein